ncbi:MAG: FAD:protein FMN transferase [bacterium]
MRKRNCRIFILMLLVLLSNSGCRENKIEDTKFLLGTIVDIKIYQTDKKTAKEAIKKAFYEIERINHVFSHYREDSFISKINKNSGNWVDVSEEVINLIGQAIKFSVLTDGAFDITIGPVVNLWGFGAAKKHYIPSDKEISDNLFLVDYKNVEIDREKNKIRIKNGTRIDMGGIAKGYAVDCVVKIFKEIGIKNALINAGGNIFVMGKRKRAKPFKIGIQHPREEKEIIAALKIFDAATATSGDYEKYFVENGKRYHHIFNPKTGRPANLCQSVTIIAKDAVISDILSTGIFVMGPETGIKLVESLPEVECFIVDESGSIIKSKGFDKYVK